MYVSDISLNFRIYDLETDKWCEGQTATKFTKYASFFAGVTSGVYAPENVYVFGLTEIDQDTVQTFTWVYDPACDVWSTAKPRPIGNMYNGLNCIVTIADILYIVGENGTIEQYVPVGYNSLDCLTSSATSNITTAIAVAPSNGHWSESTLRTFISNETTVIAVATGLLICFIVVSLCLYFNKRGTRLQV
ncbi:MAG: hypothetical protein FWF66_01895 [Candidatus Bathyarchaeota archaeon]|nr:hypothetical protein [Candidatus Termiticorpusculum sp.]